MGLMTMKPRLSRHLTTALLIALPAPALGAPALPKAGRAPILSRPVPCRCKRRAEKLHCPKGGDSW